MRKLSFLALLTCCTLFASPFVASAEETMFQCNINGFEPYNFDAVTEDEQKAQEEEYKTIAQEFESALSSSFKDSTSKCGDNNSYTQLLEKGDCTKDGSVITEITEVIAPNVSLGGTKDDPDSEIITVYAGTCCLSSESVQVTSDSGTTTVVECPDQTTVYAKTLDECKAAVGSALNGSTAATCSRRQWVISDSGLGIVKVVVKQIYTWGALTVGSIAVLTIILNGVRISMSGVSGDITEAKNKILQAIAGIVLLFMSGVILYTINPEFFS